MHPSTPTHPLAALSGRATCIARCSTLAAIMLLTPCARLSAQEVSRPLQIGADYSALGLYGQSESTGLGGVGGRIDYRLSRRVDIDARVLWFPGRALQEF